VRLFEPQLTCGNTSKQLLVGVAGHYSNHPDLLEQLRKVAAIVSDGGQDDGAGAEVTTESVLRSRRLRDRLSSDELQAMIDLYRSGTTAKQVAEKFGVSLRSVKRLLRKHGVRRERPARHSSTPRKSNLDLSAHPA
jgi:DNA-binding NtrC family response regulator